MHFKKNEITIFYNSNSPGTNKLIAYALANKKKVNKQDVSSFNVSANILGNMLNDYKGKVKDLLNKALPFYQENLRGRNFTIREWSSIIQKNPKLLINPLVHFNGQTICCVGPEDIFKLEM
jgi:arsenate reductase-like glutaredoxin family protein